jgi:hypothetical protein
LARLRRGTTAFNKSWRRESRGLLAAFDETCHRELQCRLLGACTIGAMVVKTNGAPGSAHEVAKRE